MVKTVNQFQRVETDNPIQDFHFTSYQTRLLISTTENIVNYDLVTQSRQELPSFGGILVQQKHLQFLVKNNTINLYKLCNLIEITTGSLLSFHDKLAIIDAQTLKIVDMKTMEILEIPSSPTSKLAYNSDGSLLFQLTMELLNIYDFQMRKISVANVLDFDFVSANELVTINGESVYLLIVQDMKITSVFLQNSTSTMITTFKNFVCLVDDNLVELFVLKFRPLPRLEKMYI